MDSMRPYLIYRSYIEPDDAIVTEIFPGRDEHSVHRVKSLPNYSRSRNLTKEKVVKIGEYLSVEVDSSDSKAEILATIQSAIDRTGLNNVTVADNIAKALYLPEIELQKATLPENLQSVVG
jgi:hypothetical protein